MLQPTTRPPTCRKRVLAVVSSATQPLTGHEVAKACGLTYKQTVDALNALYNHGKVERKGRKFTARWSLAAMPQHPQIHPLDLLMFRYSRKSKA